jgi:fructokinase
MHPSLLAGIEAGGTKFVCAVAERPGVILRSQSFPTRAPHETIADAIGFFRDAAAEFGPIAGLGLASFGPLDLDPSSPGFGSITRTPKPGWSGVNLRAALIEGLGCPVAVDTDVNGAGLAEGRLGAGQGLDSFVYLTIGTGIGGGLILNGEPVHGLTHPEMGHLLVRRHDSDGDFPGTCAFHGDCVEGLASGTAIFAREGKSLAEYGPEAPLRLAVADYLGQLCASISLICSPRRLILGGGVMTRGDLFPLIRERTAARLAGYIAHPAAAGGLEDYIVPPALGAAAGITGALLLGARAAR